MNFFRTGITSVSIVVIAILVPLTTNANPERGRVLYEAQCTTCHSTSVHSRESRRAQDFEGIRAQAARWNRVMGAKWKEQDITDVADYLNGRFYQYPCPDIYCNQVRAPAPPLARTQQTAHPDSLR